MAETEEWSDVPALNSQSTVENQWTNLALPAAVIQETETVTETKIQPTQQRRIQTVISRNITKKETPVINGNGIFLKRKRQVVEVVAPRGEAEFIGDFVPQSEVATEPKEEQDEELMAIRKQLGHRPPYTQRDLVFWKTQHRNTLRTGAPSLPETCVDPLPASDASETLTHEIKKRETIELIGNAQDVAGFYNAVAETSLTAREESPIFGLRTFNNWIKSVIINKFARGPDGPARKGARGARVLDLGCGKGGDLKKWKQSAIGSYVALDLATDAVELARERYKQMGGRLFKAFFGTMDCFRASLGSVVPDPWLEPGFDTVTMQFCVHYAFETEDQVKQMLKNVSEHLREGGVWMGTTTNADLLLDNLDESDDLEFGNSVYTVKFESRDESEFGRKYWFYLQDAIEHVPEFIVSWEVLTREAAKYNLYPIYKEEFHDIFAQEREKHEYRVLLERMSVIDSTGNSRLSEAQFEACNLYIGFVFEKRASA